MTFACTDCSRCGKCYDKNSVCSNCGNAINLLDDCCPVCGEPITDEMRDKARQVYKDQKKVEHEKIVALAQEAKRKREQENKERPAYPWET
jgi:predicted amidophosphoribosyltransferase